ncbi:protein of unknown function (DU1801) [Mucilaginibacter lappiensis]|uniref:YdhG-like domain-containing protein n=1 Tax=Mucilaginibacter lappiensis TaxID=354630 RepID=A0ABR6PIV6_9SPHI|nr:DUF1801 domain-containing protein [Mucilaginibacter lappiensis]MBB6109692.1 hypothetical protein [Mucilaginibacter lappiensis]SIR11993.1 protein of unknown function (DU1801) [Mucilaginibacter lappiensis]
MTLTQLYNFYLQKDEPIRGCLLALKDIILKQDQNISAEWKYGMPFFCYKGKMFCYLWVHKKYHQPYIGIVEGQRFDHPGLIIEKRSRMKIMLFEADKDLPVETINNILKQALDLYRTGVIKLNS